MIRFGYSIILFLLMVSSCGGEGSSEGKVLLYVYPAKVSTPEADPFKNVSFVRVYAEGDGVDRSKIIEYSPQSSLSLDGIPFGNGIQITVEGYTMDSVSGQVGNLISRGRTLPLEIYSETANQVIPIILSQVSQFSVTTGIGPNGTFPTSLISGRIGHAVVALKDGRILITGGATLLPQSGGMYRSPSDLDLIFDKAEIFDPVSGVFTQVLDTQGMKRSRAFHTATVLPDGRVMLAGGMTSISGSIQTLKEIQFFDPTTDSFSDPAPIEMVVTRAGHTATLIDSAGRVVFAGGFELTNSGSQASWNSIEVFDPETGPIYNTAMKHGRYFHRAVKVPMGSGGAESVVLIGGEDTDNVHDSAETFILQPPSVDAQTIPLSVGRTGHTATYVASQGFVHVVGGFTDKERTNLVEENVVESLHLGNAEFYTLVTGLNARGGHDSVMMDDGVVLLFGGYENGTPVSTANVLFDYTIPYGNCTSVDKTGLPPGLCASCSSNATCVASAGQCSQLDITGQFCTTACNVDSDCPASFYCHALVGSTQPQCVPKGEQKAFAQGGVGSMMTGRGGGVGVLLGNGMVLATGGVDSSGQLNTIGEIFNPL